MTIQEGLIDYLLDQSTVTALVGDRITPVVRTQGKTLPALTIIKISETEQRHMTGTTGLCDARIQIVAYGATHKAASDLADVVRTAMNTQRILMGTVEVTGVFRDDSSDSNDRPADGSDPGEYQVPTTYMIQYRK